MLDLRRRTGRSWRDRDPDPSYFAERSLRDGETVMAPEPGDRVNVRLRLIADALTGLDCEAACRERLGALARGGHQTITGEVRAARTRPAAQDGRRLIGAFRVLLPADPVELVFEDLPHGDTPLTLRAGACAFGSVSTTVRYVGPPR